MDEYEKLQKKARDEFEQRKKLLYAKFPRLAEIEDEMTRLSLEVARAFLKDTPNGEALLKKLHERQLDLKMEKAELLAANRYPMDYLDMRYQCRKCKDTGFINDKKCSCYKQKEINYLYMQSNIGDSVAKENLELFRFDLYSDASSEEGISPRENMKDIYRKCVNYIKNFNEHNINLLFIGSPGLGKTFLCHSIAKDLLDSGRSVIYHTAPDLIDMIRKYKFNFDKEEENEALMDEIYNCDLLIIDDLGTELRTAFSDLAIYSILSKRISKDMKTIIATNLSTDELVKYYSERINSRLLGNFTMLKFFGQDIRLKKREV